MEARQIQTRFYDDELVVDLDLHSQHLFLYLLTCRYINQCGIFQLSPRKICFESKLSSEEFEIGKGVLEEAKKAFFYNGWVFVVNAFKNNGYWKSPKNVEPHNREFQRIPADILDHFNSCIHSTIDTDIYTHQRTEISKQNTEARNERAKPRSQKNTDDSSIDEILGE